MIHLLAMKRPLATEICRYAERQMAHQFPGEGIFVRRITDEDMLSLERWETCSTNFWLKEVNVIRKKPKHFDAVITKGSDVVGAILGYQKESKKSFIVGTLEIKPNGIHAGGDIAPLLIASAEAFAEVQALSAVVLQGVKAQYKPVFEKLGYAAEPPLGNPLFSRMVKTF